MKQVSEQRRQSFIIEELRGKLNAKERELLGEIKGVEVSLKDSHTFGYLSEKDIQHAIDNDYGVRQLREEMAHIAKSIENCLKELNKIEDHDNSASEKIVKPTKEFRKLSVLRGKSAAVKKHHSNIKNSRALDKEYEGIYR